MNELESENLQHDHRLKSDLDFFNKSKNVYYFFINNLSLLKVKGIQNYSQFVDTFFQNLKQLKIYRKYFKQHK